MWGGGLDPPDDGSKWWGGGLDPPEDGSKCWGGGLDREDGSYKIQTFGVKTRENHLFSRKFPSKNRENSSLFYHPQSGWLGGGFYTPQVVKFCEHDFVFIILGSNVVLSS